MSNMFCKVNECHELIRGRLRGSPDFVWGTYVAAMTDNDTFMHFSAFLVTLLQFEQGPVALGMILYLPTRSLVNTGKCLSHAISLPGLRNVLEFPLFEFEIVD